MAVSDLPMLPPLPLQIDGYPDDLRENLLASLGAVLSRPPLSNHHEHAESPGTHELPQAMPSLLALHGARRCGKTSMAEFLERRYKDVVQLGFSTPMIHELNGYLAFSGHVVDDVNKADPDYRYLVQMWAQARRFEDAGYWSQPLVSACQEELARGARLVLMPGLREQIEKDAVESLGGEVWKIVNPNLPDDSRSAASRHPIERALDHLPDSAFARVVVNDAPDLLGWCRIVEEIVEGY